MSASLVRIAVFGPTTATVAGTEVALGPRKQRLLLAVLVSRAGTAISPDALADALWDGRPPASAPANLRLYVHALRGILGRDAIAGSGGPGYRLGPGVETDIAEFDRLCASASAASASAFASATAVSGPAAAAFASASGAAAAFSSVPSASASASAGDLAAVRGLLADAIALRRDRAYADAGDRPVVAAHVRGLEERWLLAVRARVDADLALGGGAELLGELTRLTVEHPYQERFWEQLMLALVRARRPGEALEAYTRARRTLDEELGIEPGPELKALHHRILNADPALTAGRTPRPVQLPLDVRGYVGRDAEQSELDALLDGPGTAIAAVTGPAGVGKTALAVHWAHRVADRFPDGQLYLNLRGFDPGGALLGAEDALKQLLGALGVAATSVPVGVGAGAALYRSLLAGRRMLIVLDNARDDDQVRPLLPGAAGCTVVVTSRNQLAGLIATEHAVPVLLGVLDDAAARRMLAERIGAARSAAEPGAVGRIIDHCARLPLALAVVAARAATRPGFGLHDLARELAGARAPLDAFDGPDPASDLRAVFSWSYRALGEVAARLFRLVGLHGGPHLTTAAAASLAGEPLRVVRPALAELTRAHLLIEFRPGRYTYHDLLNAYAAELVVSVEDEEERAEAVRRMVDHYLQTARLAAVLHRPGHGRPLTPAGVTLENLTDRRGARAWLAVEHPVLLRMIELCHRRTDGGLVAFDRLAAHRGAIRTYLQVTEEAQDVEDRYARAANLTDLGDGYRAGGDEESARRVWTRALAELETLGHADAAQVRAKLERSAPGQGRTGPGDQSLMMWSYRMAV